MALPENYGFTIYAQRASGAGSLYSDCLILIPIDEYMIFAEWDPGSGLFVLNIPVGDYWRINMNFAPDGDAVYHNYTAPSDSVTGVGKPYITGDGIPVGNDVRLYLLVYTTTRGNVLTNRSGVFLSAYRRYHSLQGAD